MTVTPVNSYVSICLFLSVFPSVAFCSSTRPHREWHVMAVTLGKFFLSLQTNHDSRWRSSSIFIVFWRVHDLTKQRRMAVLLIAINSNNGKKQIRTKLAEILLFFCLQFVVCFILLSTVYVFFIGNILLCIFKRLWGNCITIVSLSYVTEFWRERWSLR